jgi:hypothetical protein
VDTLVWTIAHGELTARVGEDGVVEGDADLVAMLEQRLREPVVVFRHGTVRPREGHRGDDRDGIELRPGDGRYVVARIRTLCDGEEFEIVSCDWR